MSSPVSLCVCILFLAVQSQPVQGAESKSAYKRNDGPGAPKYPKIESIASIGSIIFGPFAGNCHSKP